MYKFILTLILFQSLIAQNLYEPIKYREDDTKNLALEQKVKGSHLNVFIPVIPHSYIFRLINGTLLRLSENKRGWEYYYANKYKKINSLTYDLELMKDGYFQDGSPFDANSVVENFSYFLKSPITYTDIHNRLKSVEKVSKYKVRFHLYKPYGMFLHDLARIPLYTSSYLKKHGYEGSGIGYNTKEVGRYGLGPYVLEKGVAIGLSQDSIIKLRINPLHNKKDKLNIETITIYTKLSVNEAIEAIGQKEKLDIAFIPFNKKVEIINSPYAKLVTIPSRNNYSIQYNLQKKDGILKNEKVRQAINQIINQTNLIKFVYKDEGKYSPYPISSNLTCMKNILKKRRKIKKFSQKQLHEILNGITLKILTQDLFLELWQGLEFQLSKYGVKFIYDITTDEKDVLNQLFNDKKRENAWDMLVWGNVDWYGNHPWPLFMLLRPSNKWSSINEDKYLEKELYNFFAYDINTKEFNKSIEKILTYADKKAYLLSVPSPNSVLAVNKEVYFKPSSAGILPLWNAKITPLHWSIRKDKPYSKKREKPVFPQRFKLED